MSKIIFFGSIKGGVGKSTLAAQFAAYLGQSYKVAVMDCDPQQTLNKWAIRRFEIMDRFSSHFEMLSPDSNTLQRKSADFDYIIVDSAGVDSEVGRKVLQIADICISPLKPSQADFDTLLDHNDIIVAVKNKFNPSIKSYYVLNMCSTHFQDKDRLETLDILKLLKEQGQIDSHISEHVVFDRKILRSTFSEGGSCFDEKKNKSQDEISILIDSIL